jgi:exonuclease SbcD
MSSIRFVHAADIHLDSPLVGLELPEEAPLDLFRHATRRALENLVDLCREEDAAFLLIAGDLYDGDWRDYQTGLFFKRQMERLQAAEIPAYIVRGNHDATSKITRKVRLPESAVEFSARKAETHLLEDIGVAIHGRSYGRGAVTEDLASTYPSPVADVLNVGVLHTCVEGREGHEPYAPCRVEALANHGYDYWALGHGHQHDVLSEAPWVVFPGNIQGRHIRETGRKGAVLVTVEDGQIDGVEFRATDVVRWETAAVDLGEVDSEDAALATIRDRLEVAVERAEGRPLAMRLTLKGRTQLHHDLVQRPERWDSLVRELAIEVGHDDLWLEKVRLATRTPIDLQSLRRRDDPVGALLRGLDGLREDEDGVTALTAQFEDLRQKLPSEAREGPEALDLGDPATIRGLLDEVEQTLVPRLVDGGGK